MRKESESIMVNTDYWHKWYAWHPVCITTETKQDKNGVFKRKKVWIWREWIEKKRGDWDSWEYREIKKDIKEELKPKKEERNADNAVVH